MKLKDVPIGASFTYVDKFPDGWRRIYWGIKIGDTTHSWSAVKLTRVLHDHTETGETKMDSNAERFTLMNDGVEVRYAIMATTKGEL